MAVHAWNQTFANVRRDLRDLHACRPFAGLLADTAENVLGQESAAARKDSLDPDAKRNAVLSLVWTVDSALGRMSVSVCWDIQVKDVKLVSLTPQCKIIHFSSALVFSLKGSSGVLCNPACDGKFTKFRLERCRVSNIHSELPPVLLWFSFHWERKQCAPQLKRFGDREVFDCPYNSLTCICWASYSFQKFMPCPLPTRSHTLFD